ncbi:iron-sulfur cluster biosynthesis family protein [Virgibacillus ainsalahensis]
MQLSITAEAKEKLSQLNRNNNQYLLLWYDIDGCGCGVSGVPMIGFTDGSGINSIEVKNDSYPTLINKDQAVFFEENMKLSVVNGSFRLSSPEGILNPFISEQSVCEI